MNWQDCNTLPIADLRASIREGKHPCAGEGCDRSASDVHHLDQTTPTTTLPTWPRPASSVTMRSIISPLT